MAEDIEQIGWVITGVHDEGDESRIGWGQSMRESRTTDGSFDRVVGREVFMRTDLTADMIPSDKRVKWRSFGDGGDPAYDGIVHIDWLFPDGDEEEDPAYNIDRFCTADWGAIHVLYSGADMKRCKPDVSDFVKRNLDRRPGGHPYTPNTTFFAIYG